MDRSLRVYAPPAPGPLFPSGPPPTMRRRRQSPSSDRASAEGGYLLLPVVLMLAVVASASYLIGVQGVVGTHRLNAEVEASVAEYVAVAGLEIAQWHAANGECGTTLSLSAVPFGAHEYDASLSTGGTSSAGVYSALEDAWIRSDDVDRNNGGGTDLHIRSEGDKFEYALYRFDLSAISPGTQVNSAVVQFFVEAGKGYEEGAIRAYRVTSDWAEGTVTWSSFGGAFDPGSVGTLLPAATGGFSVSVNLTAQVQAWVNGQPNYGILLRSEAEGVHAEFSSRTAGTSQQPELVVLTGTGQTSPASISATGTLASGTSRTVQRSSVPTRQPDANTYEQPSALAVDDARVDQSNSDSNFGGHNLLIVRDDSERVFIRFGLSGLVPKGAEVREARLELFADSVRTAGSIDAFGVNGDWIEGTCPGSGCTTGVTWDAWDGSTGFGSQRVSVDATASSSTNVAGRGDFVSWEITDLAKAWVSGARPNYGIQLRSGGGEAEFKSSDHPTTADHPRLVLRFACECGRVCLTPGGEGALVLVVPDKNNLGEADQAKQRLFASWNYAVSLMSASESQSNFDSAAASNDVFYLSETITAGDISSIDFDSLAAGIVNANDQISGALGVTPGAGATSATSVTIDDVSHDITSAFTLGSVDLFEYPLAVSSISGPAAVGTQSLASFGGGTALLVRESGSSAGGGGFVAGRRAQVPFSGIGANPFQLMTGDGLILLQRSIQWASDGVFENTGGPGIWFATGQDVTRSGTPELDDWTRSDVLSLGGPTIRLEPGTSSANVAIEFDLGDFAKEARVDALHVVSRDIIVGGASAVSLLAGDLLLSTMDDESLEGLNRIDVRDEDIFVFRPTSREDYSTGSFIFLVDSSQIHSEADVSGVSLVERSVFVGDQVLQRGSLLMVTTSGAGLMYFEPSSLGLGTTSGVGSALVGSTSLSIDSLITGVDLAESTVSLGGHTIPGGNLLISVAEEDKGGVGDNRLSVRQTDIFRLAVTRTGTFAQADATLLFEGTDIGLNETEEAFSAFALSAELGSPSLGSTAHWPFDETSGNTAQDIAGGHDGGIVGATFTAGQVGGALRFDGGNDVVLVPYDETLSFEDALTITAWISPDSVSRGYQTILAKRSDVADWDYLFGIEDDRLFLGFDVDGAYEEVFADAELSAGDWTHVAVTFDALTSEVRFYVGGAEIERGEMKFVPTVGVGDLEIGQNVYGESWDGRLDEVQIHDRVLAAEEISELTTASRNENDLPGGGGPGCTVADDFESGNFSGDTGDLRWSGPWEEVGESDGFSSGDVAVTTWADESTLRIRDNQNGGEGVERSVDLSGGFTAASVEFEYWRDSLESENDAVLVLASRDGGGQWTEIGRVTGPENDDRRGPPQAAIFDLLDFVSGETMIRLRSSSSLGNTDAFYFDNLALRLNGSGCP